ncbi:MAG: efflux RND transporter periplasmic adaptor subunit [Betaproteobacteria bacterium]|nr:efflux RND transporter periplasmic adaptor subunit [Betaproteobacteria bacterium]
MKKESPVSSLNLAISMPPRLQRTCTIAALLIVMSGTGAQAQDAAKAQKGPSTVPVTVATVAQLAVPFRIQAIGNVEAHATVAVKARVDGQIVDVGFTEGQAVRTGQILFRIDPRPFEATLRQAEATHQRDRAQVDQARSQERRYQELLEKNFVSKEAYAQIRTNADTAEAVANASKAAVDNARLQLEYCTIRSPIDAYPGKINIQKGNLIRANDTTALVTLNQVHPIYVNFAVPEQQLPSLRAYMKKGALTVAAAAPNGTKPLATGTVVFVDNSVDSTTGTIRLRARFQNKDDALWPGQFVNASLTLYDQKDALVVPTQSVQTGPAGQYVFVVKADMTTEIRKITVERTDGDSSIISAGLQKGEKVVTRGQLRIAPGSKVNVKS